ncbi:hypothetical protein FIU86_10045 [Roseovarius sp. THAF9]|uniref:hypothetical protein n=1 Tax=Roseovarius sp. THAF9 TaxID=2587847 RepID=UPI0012AA534A|nr:hypothetical protein [Roseovarius sp. THAF9]QFT93187.1 hypothetical protein FIU86_10045 [Roseovarius sp. THAF9]
MIPAKADWGTGGLDWQTLGAIAGVLAFVGFLLQWRATAQRNGRDDLMVEIKAAGTRQKLIQQHDCSRAERYDALLNKSLSWAERFYGPRWSLRSFGICLSLALLYPLIAALVAWVVSGQTDIGTVPVFKEVESKTRRFMAACLFLIATGAGAVIFYAAAKYSAHAGLWARKKVENITGRAGFLSKPARPVIEWVAFAVTVAVTVTVAVAVAFAVTLAFAFAGAFAGAFAVDFAGAFAVAVAFAVTVAVAVAVAVTVTGAVAVAVAGDSETATLVLLIYSLLPLANATADWASVSVTRWFLQKAHDHRQRGWSLVSFMFLDFLAGLVCLALLLGGLVALLELWSVFAAPPLDWRAYWQAAQNNRSTGIALWLMCFTTLLPTLVHLAWALAVWLFDSPKDTRQAVEEMRYWDDTASDADQAALAMNVARQIQNGQRTAFLRFAGLLALLAPVTLYFEVWSLTGLSEFLSSVSAEQ